MSYSLRDLIGFSAIMGIVTSPAGGVPTNAVIDRMLGLTVPIPSDTAEWTVVGNSRQTAPLNSPNNAARKMDQEAINVRTAKCAVAFNEISHKGDVLAALRRFDSPDVQMRGAQVVDFQSTEFKRKHNNTRITAIASMLASGLIYANANGYILPSSSGAVRTIDFGTPSELVAGTATLPDGSTMGDWSTTTTDVIRQLSQLNLLQIKLTGRRNRYAIYGSAVPGYLQANTNLINLINANNSVQNAFAAGTIPTGFGQEGLIWIPGDNLFYIDADGTARFWWGVDKVTFLPDIDRSWFALQEGTTTVPTSFGLFDDAPQANQGGLATVNGMYSYCKIEDNPVALVQRMGDCFLPVPLDPNCIMRTDVKA